MWQLSAALIGVLPPPPPPPSPAPAVATLMVNFLVIVLGLSLGVFVLECGCHHLRRYKKLTSKAVGRFAAVPLDNAARDRISYLQRESVENPRGSTKV